MKKKKEVHNTIVVAASGKSITRDDLEYCRGKAKILAVSNVYQLAPFADWLYSCGGSWWKEYPRASVSGSSWTMDVKASETLGISHINGKPGCGLSLDPSFVFWGGDYPVGGNSGAQAVGLAYHFGAKRIVLLGFDMKGAHFFGQHVNIDNPTERNFAHWRDAFDVLANGLKSAGIELLNCSRETTLRVTAARLEDVL